jgi:hypothetical protein
MSKGKEFVFMIGCDIYLRMWGGGHLILVTTSILYINYIAHVSVINVITM